MMVQFDVKRVSKGSESFMVSYDFAKTPITQIADSIIIAGSKKGASDMHFDPREEGLMVRFRIDGDLQDYTFVPKAYEKNLATRLKLLANMNITETRLPQDGAIKGQFGDTYLDMRVSSLPVSEGEKIVIRILDYTRSLQGIDSLGFNEKNLEKIKRMMRVPNGIILTTGATGSGKSTTTYSILQGLNNPETNIITVEDPIEMNIQGINQVQVNAEIGMTFAAALRSILRQDPNVILIGEIRDSETAQIAVRASITGHLVISTIHTNNSLATIERLLDMDVERYLLSTALTGIISQRLAKQLCEHCRYQRETTQYEKKVFKRFMGKTVNTIWAANEEGCENCRKGYHGRIAIQEVLELDDEIRAAISNEHIEKDELAKMVYTTKTITMLQDALGKALDGITSFEEVYRCIEIESEDSGHYENVDGDSDTVYSPTEINEEQTTTEQEQPVTPRPATEEQQEIVQPKPVQVEQPVETTPTPTEPVAPQPVETEAPDITNMIPTLSEETPKEQPQPEKQEEPTPVEQLLNVIPQIDETPKEETKQEEKPNLEGIADPAYDDSLLDVLQNVALDEEIQLPNLVDTPGNKTIEKETQTDTITVADDAQLSVLDLISQQVEQTNTNEVKPDVQNIEPESIDSFFSQLQSINNKTENVKEEPTKQPEPAQEEVKVEQTESVEIPVAEQKETSTEEIKQEEPVEQEVQEEQPEEPKQTEVLTLEKLDDTVEEEDESNRITLSTDVQIKGPVEINAEPLVPQFLLDDDKK